MIFSLLGGALTHPSKEEKLSKALCLMGGRVSSLSSPRERALTTRKSHKLKNQAIISSYLFDVESSRNIMGIPLGFGRKLTLIMVIWK